MYEPKMKYIAVAVNHSSHKSEVEHIFIFPEFINHDDFFNTAKRLRDRSDYSQPKIMECRLVGAGFTDGTQCWGRSETLNIGSRGIVDAKLIKGKEC